MAIIDTSKGVRPCVEELATLQNFRDNLFNSDIQPINSYRDTPEIYLPTYTSSGATVTNNNDGSFTISGNVTQFRALMITSYIDVPDTISLYTAEDLGFSNANCYYGPFAGAFFNDASTQLFASCIFFKYTDSSGTVRTTNNMMFTNSCGIFLTLPAARIPISNLQIAFALMAVATRTLDVPITCYSMFYAAKDFGFTGETYKKFNAGGIGASSATIAKIVGIREYTNQIMYDNYLRKQGVLIDTDAFNNLKYYH